jgi:hypothetical protein
MFCSCFFLLRITGASLNFKTELGSLHVSPAPYELTSFEGKRSSSYFGIYVISSHQLHLDVNYISAL